MDGSKRIRDLKQNNAHRVFAGIEPRSFVSGSIIAEQPGFFTGAKATAFAFCPGSGREPSTLALISVALCAFGLWEDIGARKPLYAWLFGDTAAINRFA